MSLDNNINDTSSSPKNKRSSLIAISIIAVIIVAIGVYVWHNHNATFIEPTIFEQEANDSIIINDTIDSIAIDSIPVDSIDSIAIDSLTTDSLIIDSINNAVVSNYESIFDTSKKDMKNRLLAIEKYLEETAKNYDKGKVSSKNARIASDSVITVIDSISKEKHSKDFKHQIKAIKRKNNSLREMLGIALDSDSSSIAN